MGWGCVVECLNFSWDEEANTRAGYRYDNRNIVVVGTSRDSETARFFVASFWHLLDRIS